MDEMAAIIETLDCIEGVKPGGGDGGGVCVDIDDVLKSHHVLRSQYINTDDVNVGVDDDDAVATHTPGVIRYDENGNPQTILSTKQRAQELFEVEFFSLKLYFLISSASFPQ